MKNSINSFFTWSNSTHAIAIEDLLHSTTLCLPLKEDSTSQDSKSGNNRLSFKHSSVLEQNIDSNVYLQYSAVYGPTEYQKNTIALWTMETAQHHYETTIQPRTSLCTMNNENSDQTHASTQYNTRNTVNDRKMNQDTDKLPRLKDTSGCLIQRREKRWHSSNSIKLLHR